MVEGVLIRAANGAAVGYVSGFAAGLASSGTYLVLAALNMCGPQIQAWARTLSPGDILFYLMRSAAYGAFAGAAAGGLTGFVTGLAGAIVSATVSGAAGAAAGAATGAAFGLFGAGLTAYQILKQKDLCYTISVLVGFAAGMATANWYGPGPFGDGGGGCPGGDCDGGGGTGGGSGAPGGVGRLTRQQIAAGYGPGQCAEAAEAISRAYPEDQVGVIQSGGGPLNEPPGVELGADDLHDVFQHVVTIDPEGNVWDNFSGISGHHGPWEDYVAAIQEANENTIVTRVFPSYEAARSFIDSFWGLVTGEW